MALNHTTDDGHRFHLGYNVRGLVIMVLGSAALVGLAFGAMVLLTSPDGWMTKAANNAVSGEQAEPISFDMSSAN
jgi:hypothetical protein